jgi:hypothetical protein
LESASTRSGSHCIARRVAPGLKDAQTEHLLHVDRACFNVVGVHAAHV